MTTRRILASTAALAAVASFGVATAGPASADTEHCVSRAEYDQTDVFMSAARIESIYDVNGVYTATSNPDTFARIYYSLCWTDSQAIRIVFDKDSGLSIRWRLIDQ